jgi:hypothetical protein
VTKRPARVPELHRQHRWVVVGQFQFGLSEFEARRVVEAPDDFALAWREKAELGQVHGPGCFDCGIHAKEGIGKPCEGPARLRRLQETAAGPSSNKIALPGKDF